MSKKKSKDDIVIRTRAKGNICAIHDVFMEDCPNPKCRRHKTYCAACREAKDSPLHPFCPYCDPCPTKGKKGRAPKPKPGDLVSEAPAGANPLWHENAIVVYKED